MAYQSFVSSKAYQVFIFLFFNSEMSFEIHKGFRIYLTLLQKSPSVTRRFPDYAFDLLFALVTVNGRSFLWVMLVIWWQSVWNRCSSQAVHKDTKKMTKTEASWYFDEWTPTQSLQTKQWWMFGLGSQFQYSLQFIYPASNNLIYENI